MTLAVTRWGTGPVPAVLLHGFTLDHRSWDFARGALLDVLDARAVDLPGHGQSHAVRCRDFQHVLDEIAAVAPPRAWFIGYSQGARVALAYAAVFPARVAGMVLVSGSAGLPSEKERQRRVVSDAAWVTLLRTVGMAAFVPAWTAQPILAEPHADAALVASMDAIRASQDAEGLAHALEVMGQGAQPHVGHALRAVDVPVHLVTGLDDAKYRGLAQDLVTVLPRATHTTLRGGHAPHLVDAPLFLDITRSALAAQLPARGPA